jgi:hypothetical protein
MQEALDSLEHQVRIVDVSTNSRHVIIYAFQIQTEEKEAKKLLCCGMSPNTVYEKLRDLEEEKDRVHQLQNAGCVEQIKDVITKSLKQVLLVLSYCQSFERFSAQAAEHARN